MDEAGKRYKALTRRRRRAKNKEARSIDSLTRALRVADRPKLTTLSMTGIATLADVWPGARP